MITVLILVTFLERRLWHRYWDKRVDQYVVVAGMVRQAGASMWVESSRTGSRYLLRIPQELATHRIHEYDRVLVRGTLRSPPHVTNPGGFNERAWMMSEGLIGLLEVSRIRIHHDSSSREVMNSSNRVRRWIKTRARDRFKNPGVRALVVAMTTGDRSELTNEVTQTFRYSGLSHLLAISGLHFGIILSLVWVLFGSIIERFGASAKVRKAGLSLLVVLAGAGFATVASWSPSVTRSFIMVTIVCVGLATNRVGWLARSLLVTAVLVTIWDPKSWLSLGTQLSFSAVAGITLCLRLRKNHLGSTLVRGPFASAFLVSLGAYLATAPVLLARIGWIPLVGLLINPLAIGLTSIGLASAVVSFVMPVGGHVLAVVAAYSLQLVLEGATWLAQQDVWLIRFSSMRMALITLLPLGMAWTSRRGVRSYHRLILLLMGITMSVWTMTPSLRLEAQWLNVGQGDALLLNVPGGIPLVVDTGRGRFAGRVVAQAVDRLGASKVDVVLTHGDMDHAGGLASLEEHVTVRRLMAAWTIPAAHSSGTLRAGTLLDLPASMRGYVLHPSQPGKTNQDSVVLLLVLGRQGILLTGDIHADQERWIMAHYGPLLDAVDIVVFSAPHHGSKTSSSEQFIDRIKACFVVVSAGLDNSFGHPHSQVVQRYQSRGIRLLKTSHDGAIRAALKRSSFSVATHEKGIWKGVDACP